MSFLAIGIGIVALTILVAILSGLRDKSRRLVQELGAGVIGILDPAAAFGVPGRRLEEKHVGYLGALLPDVMVTAVRRYRVPTPGTREPLTVVATDPHLRRVRDWPLCAGRFLDARDFSNRERHAVVSRRLSEAWDWQVGHVILVGRTPFTVVGVVDTGGALDAELADAGLLLGERVVFVPRTVQPEWVQARAGPEPVLDALFLRVPPSRGYAATVLAAQRLLSQPDRRVDSAAWITPAVLLRNVRRLQTVVRWTAGSVTFLCLILGGTTLMSLMLAEIRRRVPEIGLRLSLGATRRDVAALFVLEACVVTLLAGVTGVATACALLAVGHGALTLPLNLGPASLLLPTGAALLLGACFSFWPARYAATIAPSEALRYE